MTTSDNVSAIEKALEGAELAKRECVFAAQEARKANGSDTYPSRVLDKASAVIDGLVSTLLAEARKAEAMEREIAELRKALTDASDAISAFADSVFNDNGDMTVNLGLATGDDYIRAYFADRRARALLSKDSADAHG